MPYTIHKIEPDWVLESEQLGTKNKFWFKAPDHPQFGNSEWLFKYPTAGTGQHWAEKIACEIAREMRIHVPKVELAVFQSELGSATESFTGRDYDLFLGNQILHGFDANYEQEQRFKQSDHTIGMIFEAIGSLFTDLGTNKKSQKQMAGYLLLDAVICNVDRHHENWGLLRKRIKGGWRGRLAPSFDHASSLGRELRDTDSKQNRERYLKELGVSKYIERGHGPIFVDGTEKHGPSPIQLIESCLKIESLAPYFQSVLSKLDYLEESKLQRIITEIPESWMSPLAREFAFSLLSESLKQLNTLKQ